ADHEHGVAQHRASQRDLQHDERSRNLVLAQRGEDGLDVHDVASFIVFVGARPRAMGLGDTVASRLAPTPISIAAPARPRTRATRAAGPRSDWRPARSRTS